MATMFTPPIDLYEDETQEGRDPVRDDREVGFAIQHAFPVENGERDEPAVEAGETRWGSVLGW